MGSDESKESSSTLFRNELMLGNLWIQFGDMKRRVTDTGRFLTKEQLRVQKAQVPLNDTGLIRRYGGGCGITEEKRNIIPTKNIF